MESRDSRDSGDTMDSRQSNDPLSLEAAVSEALEEGEMRKDDPEQSAVTRLSPRYEIRVKAVKDPIVEETASYRKIAEEVDGRYDAYLNSIPASDKDRNPHA